MWQVEIQSPDAQMKGVNATQTTHCSTLGQFQVTINEIWQLHLENCKVGSLYVYWLKHQKHKVQVNSNTVQVAYMHKHFSML